MKLSELALRQAPRKIFVSSGFGKGHYKFTEPVMLPDCSVAHLCESVDGTKQWYEKVVQPTLEKMGLRQTETGRIVAINKQKEN